MNVTVGRINVTYGQYFISGWGLDSTQWRPERSNGFVEALMSPGLPAVPGDFAVVLTGTNSGYVRITWDVRTAEPSGVDLSAWDEVVEISLRVGNEGTGISTVDDLDGDDEFPALPAGDMRLRLHARGRDAASAVFVGDEPVEEHLIIAWPDAAGPERVLKHSDSFGDQMKDW